MAVNIMSCVLGLRSFCGPRTHFSLVGVQQLGTTIVTAWHWHHGQHQDVWGPDDVSSWSADAWLGQPKPSTA